MSLTVPFLPLRLGSDDVGEDNVLMYVVVAVCFSQRCFDYAAAFLTP